MSIETPEERDARHAYNDAARLAHLVAASYQCPDCDADTELIEDQPGIWRLKVMHDDTCPVLLSMDRA